MFRFLALVLSLSTANALQLGVPLRTPAPLRVRMQAPATAEGEATNTAATPPAATAPAAAAAPAAPKEIVVPPESLDWTPDKIRPEVQAAVDLAPQELRNVIRRAEFWSNETATVLEIINVVGRFEKCAQWMDRNEFTQCETREETLAQSATKNRYEMALRMGCAERVALVQNAPRLPFTDAKLAASVGMTVEQFNAIPVSIAAANIVFDALAESRSGLIPYATLDSRRNEWINEDGSLNLVRFAVGLAKSRALVICAWFIFGKGNFVWVLLACQALHDVRPDLFPTPKDAGLDKIGFFV